MMVIGSTVKDIMAVNIAPSEKALKEESTATGMEWKVMDCGVYQFDVGGGDDYVCHVESFKKDGNFNNQNLEKLIS